jgi:hypothetical protein
VIVVVVVVVVACTQLRQSASVPTSSMERQSKPFLVNQSYLNSFLLWENVSLQFNAESAKSRKKRK